MGDGQSPTTNFLRLLSTPGGSIPKGAQWVVVFEDLERYILPGIRKAMEYEKKQWNIADAAQSALQAEFQKHMGCVFCQAIGITGEAMQANAEGDIIQNAFQRSMVGAGRNNYGEMRMTFLDTHISFADNFLRAWVLSTANFGLIGRRRNDPKNYRTNMTCYKLGGRFHNKPQEVLMKYTFHDVCCISVSEEEYNYSPTTTAVNREARFVYNYVEIDSEMNPFVAFA